MSERVASCGCVFDGEWGLLGTCQTYRLLTLPVASQHLRQCTAEIVRAEQAAERNPSQQPPPLVRDDMPDVTELLINRLHERRAQGIETYGTTLQPFNGRDALEDALAEALDLSQYLTQAIYERDHQQEIVRAEQAALLEPQFADVIRRTYDDGLTAGRREQAEPLRAVSDEEIEAAAREKWEAGGDDYWGHHEFGPYRDGVIDGVRWREQRGVGSRSGLRDPLPDLEVRE